MTKLVMGLYISALGKFQSSKGEKRMEWLFLREPLLMIPKSSSRWIGTVHIEDGLPRFEDVSGGTFGGFGANPRFDSGAILRDVLALAVYPVSKEDPGPVCIHDGGYGRLAIGVSYTEEPLIEAAFQEGFKVEGAAADNEPWIGLYHRGLQGQRAA